jgi:hypothetical protein
MVLVSTSVLLLWLVIVDNVPDVLITEVTGTSEVVVYVEVPRVIVETGLDDETVAELDSTEEAGLD